MITREHFTEDERAMLDRARAKDLALCREILALPRWRWIRRATLKEERRVAAETLSLLYRECEQDARDRLLLRAAEM